MKELFEKVLIKEFWGRKKSIPIAICVALLVGVCFYLKIISENNIICENNGESYPILSPTGEILVLISVVAISLLLLIYIGFVFSKYYIRKPNKEKIGIMMYIDTDNEELYNDTVRKFGEEFKKSILSGFELVYIPYDSMVIEKNDARKITSL